MTNHDAANYAVATAAATSPWWLPVLREVSEIAALIAPILAVIWLIVQIVLKLYAFFKDRPRFDLDPP